MTSSSQSPRDRILWVLSESSGKLDRSSLRRRAGIVLADLDPILAELTRDGRIRMSGEMVSLN